MWLKIQMNHHLGEAMKVLKLVLQPPSKPKLESWNLYSWAHREWVFTLVDPCSGISFFLELPAALQEPEWSRKGSVLS